MAQGSRPHGDPSGPPTGRRAPDAAAARPVRPGPGRLKVFLGAAPGVGKTYRMLDEGRRRARRGTDVVVGLAECHGRPHTEALLHGLPALAPRIVAAPRPVRPGGTSSYGGTACSGGGHAFGGTPSSGGTACPGGAPFPEGAARDGGDAEPDLDADLDLDAVLARRPDVVLIDELAHANAPGGRHERRWQDIEELLAAGIDVVTTVNIQHLESLNDVVEKITGVPQRETVPDEVVRRAQQIELVDLPPEGLRRRMAHGNIYAPEKIDAALSHYFRIGNLTALRELALLWVAGRVDEGLQRYRAEHGIGRVWETRERVVVGITGGPEGETLIRRAARIAARSAGGDLLAVHVTRSHGQPGTSPAVLAEQRRLVESLGGSYHFVVGDEVPTALLEFARAENATQLVVGVSRRRRLPRLFTPNGVGETMVALSGDIDVHMVTHEQAGRGRTLPAPGGGLPMARRIAGPVAGLVLPVVLTMLLRAVSGPLDLNLTSELLIFLVTVVGVACIGGVLSALLASATASLLLNYYFVPPIEQFSLVHADYIVVHAAFAAVAVTVAAVVDRTLRLARRAAHATAEAEILSSLAGGVLRGEQAVPVLLDRTRETFGMDSVELLPRTRDGERDPAPPESTEPGERARVPAGEDGHEARAPMAEPGQETRVPVGEDAELVLRGRGLAASERRMLTAFAAHLAAAAERARLAEAAAEIEPVKAADRMRSALLAAVSHDLRTPLASGWAAVSSLRSRDVHFTEEDREELLATAEESLAKLSRLVDNLLDMSRLRAGALSLRLQPTSLGEVLPPALDTLPETPVRIAVQDLAEAPDVLADPPLLERVIANLVANATRHSPPDRPVTVAASVLAARVELRVIDRGPGMQLADRERAFAPFQRLGDTDNTTGLGLGLALSRGLTEAMGGTLTTEDTPGGGLTMVVSLPAAPAPVVPVGELLM